MHLVKCGVSSFCLQQNDETAVKRIREGEEPPEAVPKDKDEMTRELHAPDGRSLAWRSVPVQAEL